MSVRFMLREIAATLADIVVQGAPWGHLVALWEVLTGKVRADDRVEVA